MNTNLTDNEVKILNAIADYEFTYFDSGIEAGSWTHTLEFCYEIAHLLGVNIKAAGAHLSNLNQKGIFDLANYDDASYAVLTEDGANLITELTGVSA